jgi:hypothetical protein
MIIQLFQPKILSLLTWYQHNPNQRLLSHHIFTDLLICTHKCYSKNHLIESICRGNNQQFFLLIVYDSDMKVIMKAIQNIDQ